MFIYVEKAIKRFITRMRFTQVQELSDEMVCYVNIVELGQVTGAH